MRTTGLDAVVAVARWRSEVRLQDCTIHGILMVVNRLKGAWRSAKFKLQLAFRQPPGGELVRLMGKNVFLPCGIFGCSTASGHWGGGGTVPYCQCVIQLLYCLISAVEQHCVPLSCCRPAAPTPPAGGNAAAPRPAGRRRCRSRWPPWSRPATGSRP